VSLFGFTSLRFLWGRCGPDAPPTAGSVAGLGPQAPWSSGHRASHLQLDIV